MCKTVDSISVDCVLNGGILCFIHTKTFDTLVTGHLDAQLEYMLNCLIGNINFH